MHVMLAGTKQSLWSRGDLLFLSNVLSFFTLSFSTRSTRITSMSLDQCIAALAKVERGAIRDSKRDGAFMIGPAVFFIALTF